MHAHGLIATAGGGDDWSLERNGGGLGKFDFIFVVNNHIFWQKI